MGEYKGGAGGAEGGQGAPPPPIPHLIVEKRKIGEKDKKEKFQIRNHDIRKKESWKKADIKVEKFYFIHSRVSGIQKFTLSVNHGDRKCLWVFHCPHTLKCFSLFFTKVICLVKNLFGSNDILVSIAVTLFYTTVIEFLFINSTAS